MPETKPKLILAYSGGLDTSVILKWLLEKGFDVIAFCANVGQFEEDFAAVKAKAVSCGASKCIVTDLRKDFVDNYVFEAIKSNAIYEGRYLLGTSIARPCIAKEMIRIATEEGAAYIAHGATGKGNDQVRFEMCAQALSPTIQCVAPWRDAEFIESFKGRSDLLAYCQKHGIPVDAKPKSNYSIDENLFHTSYESGMLEDAMCGPEESMFKMTVSPQRAPDAAETIRIEFTKGLPTKITNSSDGTVITDSLELFLYCNTIAGKHGIGRIDIVENRFVGIKSRGVYETPGGTLLRAAHLDLEGITMDREVKRISEGMASEFARLCYNGFWFAPEMDLIRHALDYSQRDVTGLVELELYKGNVTVRGRSSPKALYNADLASMDIEGGGDAFDYNPYVQHLHDYYVQHRDMISLTNISLLILLIPAGRTPMALFASMPSDSRPTPPFVPRTTSNWAPFVRSCMQSLAPLFRVTSTGV
jgi:argininosuccinate synthase